MNVVYASDEKFAEILLTSIESLCKNNNSLTKLKIYILDDGLTQLSRERINEQVKKYDRNVYFIAVPKLETIVGVNMAFQKKLSRATFHRLFCARLLPQEIESILYIDCDTLVLSSLKELENYEFDGYCAAVDEPTAPMMKNKIELKSEDDYFNAGVMLINLKKWRENDIEQLFLDYIKEKKGKISFEDQGVINHVLSGKITRLPMKYNVTTQWYAFGIEGFPRTKKSFVKYDRNELTSAISNPSILHLTNCFVMARPWIDSNQHPYAKCWLEYRKNISWDDGNQWNDNRGIGKKICAFIYHHLHGNMKYDFVYLSNGFIRPVLESLKGVK